MKKIAFVIALLFLVSACASRKCCRKRYVNDAKPKVEVNIQQWTYNKFHSNKANFIPY